jgi:hypothetical protein
MTIVADTAGQQWYDAYARECFGLEMRVPMSRQTERTLPADTRKDEEGFALPYIDRWAYNSQYKRYGHHWPGMHAYRLDDSFTDETGARCLFYDPRKWDARNGEISAYLTCEDIPILTSCMNPKTAAAHGQSIMPVRTIAANFHACWKCLDASLRRSRSGTCASTEHPRATSFWSTLNGPLRPDMVPAKSGSINVIFDCPRCAAHWFMAPDGPNVNGTGCPVCSANVSKPQIALHRLLAAALPDERIALEHCVAGRSASDIAILSQRIAVEYDGTRFHRHADTGEHDKDSALANAGWRTIRVREELLGDATFPGTLTIHTRSTTYVREDVVPRVLAAFADLGVAVHIDRRAVERGLTEEIKREIHAKYDSRCNASRRRGSGNRPAQAG